MKKINMFVALIVTMFVFPLIVCSEIVTVTWKIPKPESDLAGFYIYLNDVKSITINDINARLWKSEMDVKQGLNIIEMTAFDESGNESERSLPAEYPYDTIPPKIPVGIEVY